MEGFYRWDESMALFKGLPNFKDCRERYKTFLLEREDEIQSLMVCNIVLKEYYLKMGDLERTNMRKKACLWANVHFPEDFLLPQKPITLKKKGIFTHLREIFRHK
jgi:hypothetical protein